jgi:tRNA pseudouridine55 synthase
LQPVYYDNPLLFLRETGLIIPMDKPLGWTSFDVVNKMRVHLKYTYKLPKIKVGHAGTLDPLATGLLLVCLGKTTRKITELQDMGKRYTGIIRLGETTPSFDGETEISERMPWEHITPGQIHDAAARLSGPQMQVPPIFSAIKIDGRRAYKSARNDQELEIPPRPVTIHHFMINHINGQEVHFDIACSKGTYIRSLARDLGVVLGTCAYLTQLRRTQIGHFDVANAFGMDNFDDALPFRKGATL